MAGTWFVPLVCCGRREELESPVVSERDGGTPVQCVAESIQGGVGGSPVATSQGRKENESTGTQHPTCTVLG